MRKRLARCSVRPRFYARQARALERIGQEHRRARALRYAAIAAMLGCAAACVAALWIMG
jgi:hypothetical protein